MRVDPIDPVDKLDIKILEVLQKDARKSYREIADAIGVATGTVYNRLKKLMEDGIVHAFIPLIDPSKVGFDLTALILAQVEGEYLVNVENRIAKFDNVCMVYDITGEYDVAIIARFRDRASLNTFIKSILKIPYVKRTVTSVVLNVVKEDPRLKL